MELNQGIMVSKLRNHRDLSSVQCILGLSDLSHVGNNEVVHHPTGTSDVRPFEVEDPPTNPTSPLNNFQEIAGYAGLVVCVEK